MSFYAKVKTLCKMKGISISTLANCIGLSSASATNWKAMSEDALPRENTVKKVADFFNVDVSYFYELELPIMQAQDNMPVLSDKEQQLYELLKIMTDDEIEELTNYIDFIISKRK